jgi:hypothetical protein
MTREVPTTIIMTIKLAKKNSVFHDRSKHINIYYYILA